MRFTSLCQRKMRRYALAGFCPQPFGLGGEPRLPVRSAAKRRECRRAAGLHPCCKHRCLVNAQKLVVFRPVREFQKNLPAGGFAPIGNNALGSKLSRVFVSRKIGNFRRAGQCRGRAGKRKQSNTNYYGGQTSHSMIARQYNFMDRHYFGRGELYFFLGIELFKGPRPVIPPDKSLHERQLLV